jgi:hypothetical protein
VIVDGGESAKSLSRPGMARLRAMVDEGEVKAVIIAKLDRLTRSVKGLCTILERFERRGGPRIGRRIARHGLGGRTPDAEHHDVSVAMRKRSGGQNARGPP